MNYKQAVENYQKDKSRENLYKTAKELCESLTLNEKVHMLSGNNWPGLAKEIRDLIIHKRVYNYVPYEAGGVRRLGIPPVAFADGPRGVVLGNSTCFPVSMARGAAFDRELEYEVGTAIAQEALAGGANYFAGICINLLRNPRWGRAQESYGEDPYLLGEMGVALTKAVQNHGVMACPKHYACNSLENLRFEVDVTASKRTMHEVYLPHFKKCIDAGAVSIMGAYNKFEGDHCCESKWLLKDVLRDTWGFTGFTLSDFIWGVRNGAKALKAGMDIEMPLTMQYGKKIKQALKQGEISMQDIDNSVQSILRGMLQILPNQIKVDKSVIACKRHMDLARRVSEAGTVLLKNNDILPLQKGKKIAVIGRYADNVNVGDHGSSTVHSNHVVTPYVGIQTVFGAENVSTCDWTQPEQVEKLAKSSDVVVIIAGLDYTDEGEYIVNKKKDVALKVRGGDRVHMGIPVCDLDLIRRVAAVNENVVVSLQAGSALIINEWSDLAKGILMSFYSGSEGGTALANILCGACNPSGKLPFTVAHDMNDYPAIITESNGNAKIDYGYYHGYMLFDKEEKSVDYPFGFGLSYTTFAISDLSVDRQAEQLLVTAKLKNTGDVDGAEVVQVYAGSLNKDEDRPVKLLKGFQKQSVAAGETMEVMIPVNIEELRFYDEEQDNWVLDPAYRIYVGSDSYQAMNLYADVKL